MHALGYSNHGKEFRRVEALWPDYSANELGKSFSKMLLEKERSGSGYAHHVRESISGPEEEMEDIDVENVGLY